MILNSFKCGIFIICFFISITNSAVHCALVTETTFKGFFNDDRPILKECTEDEDCMGNKQYCNKAIGYCECQQFYQYRVNTSNCNPCPGEGESCMSCCSSSTLICYNQVCTRCDTGYFECEFSYAPPSAFMNASQIALVAALIMGAAALATLLYRICTKPRYFGTRRLRTNRNAEATESEFQRIARASLSSIQIRVISRLRDRPPKYETQHNYDMRIQRQEEEIQQRNNSNVNISTTSAINVQEQAPPPYDGSKESVNESPPPYSDTSHDVMPDVLSHTCGTSQPDGGLRISIISTNIPEVDGNNSLSENKVDRTVHM